MVFGAVGVLVWIATHLLLLTAIPILLAAFFLWFFRDPERNIPEAPGLIVSPADGKVTAIETIQTQAGPQRRVSIFLSVFDVHVNRAPIAGNIQRIDYQKGKFLNAMNPDSATQNERNYVEVAGELCTVAFTQIAGLLARRIVFQKQLGDWVHRGERVGLIKFGSRVDVVFPLSCDLQVGIGQQVRGGASILAIMPASDVEEELLAVVSSEASPFGLVSEPVR
ncbi:MAG TPA: phosphatidylserine decarboxylase [Acidobacteriaceae bacterium]|nr:phosphatidylserine decarboxylase [Acidobacteriaceae bacterium]